MHRDLGADRGGEVGDRRQGFVIHVDEFDGVLGDVSAVGHDERDGVADELDLTVGQWRAGVSGTSLPATACHASLTSGLRSAAVKTARTPGSASAAAASIPLIRACANGLRTKHACSMPGRVTSSTKVPWPVSRRVSSTRGTRVPA